MSAAHQELLRDRTKKSKPVKVKTDEIAATGYPLHEYADVEKVQRMQHELKKKGKLKPVRLVPLTPELREKYGVTDESKKFYLVNGHHRFAAAKLEGKKHVRAVDWKTGRRL